MQEIISKLIKGDHTVIDTFADVKKKWDFLLQNFDWNSESAVQQISHLAKIHQFEFEDIAGNTWLGQQIMVLVGIGQFYNVSEGFNEDNMRKVLVMREGFLESNCSDETKSYLHEATKLFELEIEDNESENI